MNDYSKKLLNCQTINRVVNIVQSLNRQELSASHVTHLIALLLDGAIDSQKLAEKINALLFSPQRSDVATQFVQDFLMVLLSGNLPKTEKVIIL